ncbi:Uncharacterised protein [BD1-7 clade bacterium]|uniref:Uncharacterized protein n=1 Tax=BD1-7 clade bacterium TaxID=2029982 RepID=A0A5S9N9B9_9GAMM|nr:Uncharacterised protein [BD1-7 clade bacterium]
MNKVIHTSLLTVILAVIAYAVVAFLSGGEAVFGAIAHLPAELWLAILGLSLANYLLRYIRWHLYITHDGHARVPHKQHLAVYLAGFSLTMTPGKAGEAMRSLYLKPYGVAHQRSMGAFFVERILDLLAILLMAGMSVSFLASDYSVTAAVVTVSLIVACLVVIKIPKRWIIESPLVKRLPDKLRHAIVFIESMLDNANDLLCVRLLVVGLLIGIVAWGLEGYGLYIVMQAFSPDLGDLSLSMAIYGMGILLGALSLLPGGVGGAEAAMIFLLVKVGFDEASAVAITFICRLATLWFAVAIGGLMMMLLPLLGVKLPEKKESV